MLAYSAPESLVELSVGIDPEHSQDCSHDQPMCRLVSESMTRLDVPPKAKIQPNNQNVCANGRTSLSYSLTQSTMYWLRHEEVVDRVSHRHIPLNDYLWSSSPHRLEFRSQSQSDACGCHPKSDRLKVPYTRKSRTCHASVYQHLLDLLQDDAKRVLVLLLRLTQVAVSSGRDQDSPIPEAVRRVEVESSLRWLHEWKCRRDATRRCFCKHVGVCITTRRASLSLCVL